MGEERSDVDSGDKNIQMSKGNTDLFKSLIGKTIEEVTKEEMNYCGYSSWILTMTFTDGTTFVNLTPR